MSNSEKTPDLARVRFRDGDDLVEFEGSTKDVKRSKEIDPRAKSPTKVRKSSKKNADGNVTDNSSASELDNAKGSKLVAGDTKHRSGSSDSEVRPVKPPPPPPPPVPPARPPPPTTIKTETESAVDDPRSSLEERSEDLKLKYYSAFQTINRIHGGAIMKIKTGVTGITPAKDSFPMFTSIKKFTCFHWDADNLPADWCIAYYSDTPDWFTKSLVAVGGSLSSTEYAAQVVSTGPSLVESSLFPLPPLQKAMRTIPLSSISEIVVDSGNGGFRLYCGKEVVHFTPISGYNPLARRPACWADAVYSALSLVAEPDPELVQLHKQEFVDVLAQHSSSTADSPTKGASTTTADTNPMHTKGKRPGMLRRRSTLSNFFGVGASKPLQESLDEQDTANDGTQPEMGPLKETAPTNNAIGGDSPASSPRRKMSLSFAVKMVRGAMKRSVSAPSSTFREATDELAAANLSGNNKTNSGESEAELLYDNVYARNSVTFYNNDSAPNNSSAQDKVSPTQNNSVANSGYNSGNDSGSDRISVSRQNSQSSFLSQSVLSNLFNTGRHGAATEAVSSKVNTINPSVVVEDISAPDALQAQINALLEQNRALQQQLEDKEKQNKTVDANSANSTTLKSTSGQPNTTMTAPYASDTDTSQSSLSTAPQPTKVYTTDELSTLRAFTSRNNFHQNKSAIKNTTRAFGTSSTLTSTTGASTAYTKYPFQSISRGSGINITTLSAQQIHENYGPGSKRSVTPVTHVLGKQTVLDLLLAQSQASPNNTAPNSTFTSIGDDYYNDTIELEPQQIAQLIELKKLQREHARRAESTDTTNVITTNNAKLVLDENDCAVPQTDASHVPRTVSPIASPTHNYLFEQELTDSQMDERLSSKSRGYVRDATSDHRKSTSSADVNALLQHALSQLDVAKTHTTDPSRATESKTRTPLGAGIQKTTSNSTTVNPRPVVAYITGVNSQNAAPTATLPTQPSHAPKLAPHTVPMTMTNRTTNEGPVRTQPRGVPLGHQLSQQQVVSVNSGPAGHTPKSSISKPSKQSTNLTDAKREQKLLSILSGEPAQEVPAESYLQSSDEEVKSDIKKQHSGSNSTAKLLPTTASAEPTNLTSPVVQTKLAKKGFLARLNQNNNNSKVSKVGKNLLSAAQSVNHGSVTQQKERSYSADLSNLSGSERGTSNTPRSSNKTGAKVKSSDLEKGELDPLLHLQPPQWSNSYYYHSPNNSTKSASLGRSPDRRPKRSKFGSEKGTKSPTNDPENIKHTITAVSTDGSIQCTLLNNTQFTTSVSTRGDVCYLSATGFAPLHSTKTKNNNLDEYFLLLETPRDSLVVPLSGVAAAELDTNNTGLFKLSFALTSQASLHNHSFATGGIVNRLISEQSKSKRNMSVVLKAEDTLALVDWLTVLLDLKYVPNSV
eukprot:gene11025-12855_t